MRTVQILAPSPADLVERIPPLVSLVAAAEATTALRLGTFVFDNDFRHPVMAAREAAALAVQLPGVTMTVAADGTTPSS